MAAITTQIHDSTTAGVPVCFSVTAAVAEPANNDESSPNAPIKNEARRQEQAQVQDLEHQSDPIGGGVSLMWNNTKVVLTHREELDRLSADEQQQPVESLAPGCSAQHRVELPHQQDDFGWRRNLPLRSDVPTLKEILDWSFDVLVFEEAVLIQVFLSMLDYYDLYKELSLDRQVLEQYSFEVMERHNKGYYPQDFYGATKVATSVTSEQFDATNCESSDFSGRPVCEYHNWYHAVAASHFAFLLLSLGGADAYLSDSERFAIIIGGLVHDLDHPGNDNNFEVKTETELAAKYENVSVIENHSISESFELCRSKDELNWLKSFGAEENARTETRNTVNSAEEEARRDTATAGTKDRQYFEMYMREIILATDPAKHGDFVEQALQLIDDGRGSSSPTQGEAEPTDTDESPEFFDRNDPKSRLLLGSLIIKSADISNPVIPNFPAAQDWATRVISEFTRQASKELELSISVTPYMEDLDTDVKVAIVQQNFFGFMVKPLFQAMGVLLPKTKHLVDWGVENCEEYQKIVDSNDTEC